MHREDCRSSREAIGLAQAQSDLLQAERTWLTQFVVQNAITS